MSGAAKQPRLVSFYFARISLRMTKATRLHAQHAPTLYALISNAYGHACESTPVMPDGVMLEAPEQCRLFLAKHDLYAFGLTILAYSADDAARRLDAILTGLKAIGRRLSGDRIALGGNFTLSTIEDRVAGRTRHPHQKLEPFPLDAIAAQLEQVRQRSTVTLRFQSPLRTARPKQMQLDGHGYFDRHFFSAEVFFNRLVARLRKLGVVNDDFQLAGHWPAVESNQLIWLEASYGAKRQRKALGGAVGRVVLQDCRDTVSEALVWGQFVHAGGQTRFGFGRYEIEELAGPLRSVLSCPRACSLWQLATADAALDLASNELDLESGTLREAVEEINSDSYEPDRHAQVPITSGNKTRVLSIPSRRDRALQKIVLKQIGPAIDLFLEESSLAYRHGLGRQRAARRIRDAYRRGFRWGVKADFAAFFDSVDHHELKTRVEAYLSDDSLTRLIMRWVQKGAPTEGLGLPTGAPLSPLLANILLDRFDEEVSLSGGFLVRYADDFLILFQDESDAQKMFEFAKQQAAELKLALNTDKTQMIDLYESFHFLGYQFYRKGDWEVIPPAEPALLDDIGWRDSSKDTSRHVSESRLRGESLLAPRAPQATVIWGPGVTRLATQGNQIQGFYGDSRPPSKVSVDRIREMVILGPPSIGGNALKRLMKHGCTIFLADEIGRCLSTLSPEEQLEDADAISAQVSLQSDEGRRLEFARPLLAAKLLNYAELSYVYHGRDHDYRTARQLRKLAKDARQAKSMESLLGYEGSGARIWYDVLPTRLPRGFDFENRVAPAADDPVNVLLNIGHTMVYRMLIMLIRQAGLVPSLGILHKIRAGHAALASDLQEPWRHLVERAVLETLQVVRRSDFVASDHPDFPLRVSARASRTLTSQLHTILSIACQGKGQSSPRPYRYHMQGLVRAVKRWLLNPGQEIKVFEHP